MYQRGVMMLEILFVIIIAALLITVSVRLYLSYQHDTTRQLIKHDLMTLRDALNIYYQSLPCDQQGRWQGVIDTNVIDQLKIDPRLNARQPIVSAYKAYVRLTDQTTKRGQPVYLLEVRAKLTASAQSHVKWLQSYFDATGYTKRALFWRGLPSLFRASQSKALWVLDASRAQFQQQQTQSSSSIAFSHAYCAR